MMVVENQHTKRERENDVIYKEDTSSYNERRYGKPWIAKLEFSSPGKPTYVFGDWLGQPGREGELSIDVEPGDVIATGQKDHRKVRGGADHIGVVQLGGGVKWGYTPAKARDAGIEVRESRVVDITPTNLGEELAADLATMSCSTK